MFPLVLSGALLSVVVSVLFTALPGPVAGQSAPIFAPKTAIASTRLAGLDAYVERAMAAWEVPGLALAIVKDGVVIHARGYGVTALGGTEPVTEHTRFAIASTTKAMTVAALALLVDEGKLRWDDPVRIHLPNFEVADPEVSRSLTVRDLLTHRTGAARLDNLWIASPFARAEIVARLRHLPQSEGFRAGYAYNNLMYLTAGELAGTITGRSWDDLLEDRLFSPLGMSRSTTRAAEVERGGDAAHSHTKIEGVVTQIPRRDYDAIGGAGAVWSTAHDMAKWVSMHLSGGRLPDGTPLLSEDRLVEIMTPQIVIPLDSVARRLHPTNHFLTYALGWRVQDLDGLQVIQHSGSINYTRTQATMVPTLGVGIVAMANLSSSNLQLALTHWVLDALAGRTPLDWSQLYLEVQARSESVQARSEAELRSARIADAGPTLALEGYVGRFSDPLFGEIQLRVEPFDSEVQVDPGAQASAWEGASGNASRLVLTYSSEYVADLEPWHQDLFRAHWRRPGAGSTFVRFTVNERGVVTLAQVDGFATFRRASGG